MLWKVLSAMLVFLLLHFYTWSLRQFLPGDPFRVQIWPMHLIELFLAPYFMKILPNFGPFCWGSLAFVIGAPFLRNAPRSSPVRYVFFSLTFPLFLVHYPPSIIWTFFNFISFLYFLSSFPVNLTSFAASKMLI